MRVSDAFEINVMIVTSATASSMDTVLRTQLPERRVRIVSFDAAPEQAILFQVIAATEDVPEAADTVREALAILLRESDSGALPTIRVVSEDELLRLSQQEVNPAA